MKPSIKNMLFVLIFFFLLIIGCFFIGSSQPSEDVEWGVNYSVKQTEFLGLDSKQTYLALLDDLKVRKIKISVHWDLIEKENNNFDFSDLDWQVQEAEKRGAEIILAVGMKVPRWPECHMPDWARNMDKKDQQDRILRMIGKVVNRYKDSSSLVSWQVENEVFLNFGACPWTDAGFLKKEVDFVKNIDDKPIIITESGELSLWLRSGMVGDIVGVTTYRKVWQEQFKYYLSYHLPAVFYERRANLLKFFGKKVIGTELQAEPWCKYSIINASIDEQMTTMDINHFRENIEFARKTGINTFYFWGAEWWYWMKEEQNHPEYWEEARYLFQ
ncbi:MAG: beta-galactosidase [Candidatus Pacebacteria bacterium]|jgi:hypothetical protein|nr:beta-galactosidase [Candidatus Paceibacterota bacterium]